ncbi:hypothetical protein EMCRGX_G022034 [Ephydatia muelleri]
MAEDGQKQAVKSSCTERGEKDPLLPSHATSATHNTMSWEWTTSNNNLPPIRPAPVRFREGSSKRLCCLVLTAVGLLLVAVVGVTLGVSLWIRSSTATESLPQAIKIGNLMEHLKELQAIALLHNNSRSVEKGYNASAEMVMTKLANAGYNVTTQPFSVFVYEDLAPNNAIFYASLASVNFQWKFLQGSEYAVLRYSGSTPGGQVINATLQPVSGGCSMDDFSGFLNGSVALLDYDEVFVNCSLFDMASNAKAANASAVVWGRGPSQAGIVPPTSRVYRITANSMYTVDIPMLGTTYEVRTTLLSLWKIATDKNVTLDVQLKTYTSVTSVYTYNVLATTNSGNDNAMIVVGSHLDSVSAGPGINDNGSGVSANLEMALQVATRTVRNKVRFAFWSAEELGLLGSYHYVMNLTPEEKNNTALNLNYDMMASPNFVRGVYNGSGAPDAISTQSRNIQSLFEKNFRDNKLQYEIWPFNGRSDYGSFILPDINIPAGSIATGADPVKTIDERTNFGGFANTIFDPCYHTVCDTIENINQAVFIEMATAAAYVLEQLMMKEDLAGFLMSS